MLASLKTMCMILSHSVLIHFDRNLQICRSAGACHAPRAAFSRFNGVLRIDLETG
jgi:hypothetical protein